MWIIISLLGRITIYQNLIQQIAFQKRSCTVQDWGLSLRNGVVWSLYLPFFLFFFFSFFMSGDMSNVPEYQKNEHCIQPWFNLVEGNYKAES